MNIIHTLLTNNIPIELYHVKGHVNVNSNNSLINAINVFRSSNRISMNVDYDLIRQISECNDQVDRFTKFMLNYEVNPKEYTEAIAFGYGGIDTNRYRGLLNGKVG